MLLSSIFVVVMEGARVVSLGMAFDDLGDRRRNLGKVTSLKVFLRNNIFEDLVTMEIAMA